MNDIRHHWGMGAFIFSSNAEQRINNLSSIEFQNVVLFLREITVQHNLNNYPVLSGGLIELKNRNRDFLIMARKSGSKIEIVEFFKKSYVKCQNCGSENGDPGGDLNGYRCGKCGGQTLVRIPLEEERTGRIALSGVGAAIGAGVAGPIGAILGAGIGYLIGEKADKEKNLGSKK